MPEATASLLRQWYDEGPKEELVIKDFEGCPDPKLLEEFRRFCAQHTQQSPQA